MAQVERSIVVIGASAGGIQALLDVVAGIPENSGVSVFVVVHVGSVRSKLPTLLTRVGPFEATHAEDGEPIRAGHVYVAPSDVHMLVRERHIELSHGPRENHSRPAVDPLFRSAAEAHGSRVTGVILSGALSDGAAGLLMIRNCGGRVIVQDPDEAVVVGMPQSALRMVAADHVLPAAEIGQLLGGGSDRRRDQIEEAGMDQFAPHEHLIEPDFAAQKAGRRSGQLTMYTCPDCGGTLWQADAGNVVRFQCHVGHAWGPETLLGLKTDELEASFWSSVRLLEERGTLARQVALHMTESNHDAERIGRVEHQADLDEQRASTIRQLLATSMSVN